MLGTHSNAYSNPSSDLDAAAAYTYRSSYSDLRANAYSYAYAYAYSYSYSHSLFCILLTEGGMGRCRSEVPGLSVPDFNTYSLTANACSYCNRYSTTDTYTYPDSPAPVHCSGRTRNRARIPHSILRKGNNR